jgi:hypothetical protein
VTPQLELAMIVRAREPTLSVLVGTAGMVAALLVAVFAANASLVMNTLFAAR